MLKDLVLKISRSQSARILQMDHAFGSQPSPLPPLHSKLRSAVPALCVEYILSLEINDMLCNFMANIKIIFTFTAFGKISGI